MSNTLLQVKVDSELKRQVDDLFSEMGLDIPTAIRMFFKRAIYEHGILFKVNNFNPNKKLLEALKEADDIIKHPKNYKSYSNFQEILDEIYQEIEGEKS